MRALYISNQTPHVSWKWVQHVAHLFDLSGFVPVSQPVSVLREHHKSNYVELKNPYWN